MDKDAKSLMYTEKVAEEVDRRKVESQVFEDQRKKKEESLRDGRKRGEMKGKNSKRRLDSRIMMVSSFSLFLSRFLHKNEEESE